MVGQKSILQNPPRVEGKTTLAILLFLPTCVSKTGSHFSNSKGNIQQLLRLAGLCQNINLKKNVEKISLRHKNIEDLKIGSTPAVFLYHMLYVLVQN